MPDCLAAARTPRPVEPKPATDDRLIEIQATAIRAVRGRLTPTQLEDIRRGIQHACQMPKGTTWDHRATAHVEVFALLADADDDPLLAQALNTGVGFVHHLMVAAGPATGTITANSRKRLLAFLVAGDPDEAEHEMEGYLRVLRFMTRLTGTRAPTAAAG